MVAARIREPTIADTEAMGEVHVRAWQAAYRSMMPDDYLDGLRPEDRAAMWCRQIDRVGGEGLLVAEAAEDPGVIAGFVAFGPERLPADTAARGRGEVYAINLDPAWWGRGIGRRLFQAAVEGLGQRGFDDMVLWVLPENARARALYDSEGWAPDGASKTEVLLGVTVAEIRYVRMRGGG